MTEIKRKRQVLQDRIDQLPTRPPIRFTDIPNKRKLRTFRKEHGKLEDRIYVELDYKYDLMQIVHARIEGAHKIAEDLNLTIVLRDDYIIVLRGDAYSAEIAA